MRSRSRGELLFMGITYLLCGAIVVPILLIVAVSFTETPYISFPPKGFTLEWYRLALGNARLMDGLIVSLQVGLYASLLSTALGIIGGIALVRHSGRFEQQLSALFLAPLTIPVIVLAIGLVFFLTTLGLVRSLEGLVIGHTVITLPYSVRMISAALGRSGTQFEQAAAVLGANGMQVFARITLPSISAGVVVAFLFSFLVSLNNVTIALFIAGARTQTLPVLMFQMSKEEITPEMAALASILVIITFVFMLVLENRFGVYEMLERRRGA